MKVLGPLVFYRQIESDPFQTGTVFAARAPPRPTPFRGTSPSLAEPGDRGSLGNSSTDIGSGVVVVPAVAFFPSAVAYLMCWQRLGLDGLAEPGHTNACNQSSGFRYT